MNIRLYKNSDYPTVQGWYADHSQWPLTPESFTETSSFILENEKGEPWLCWVLYLTNSNICWLEGLISNPNLKEGRREAVKNLHKHIVNFAHEKGFTKMFGMSADEKITNLCEKDLGFLKTCNSVTTLIKDI